MPWVKIIQGNPPVMIMDNNLPNFYKPVINVVSGGIDYSLSIAEFSVLSDLQGKADTCRISLEDHDRTRGEAISQGDSLSISWGYEGNVLTEIFRGVVLDNNHSDPLEIRGIDYNTVLNAMKIKQTYQDDTVSGIMKSVLNSIGLELDIEDCEVVIDRIPFFNRSIRECIDSLTSISNRETGEEYFDYIREGIFHWGKKDLSQSPSAIFTTGVNIIDLQLNENGLSELFTMISPVLHSQVIKINGESYFAEKVEYNW
ncbi:MAG: hypothetical protein H8E87_05600, partial [FCB group bacterium]|nr:hypothetical protein [FCB group bacterium]